MTDIDKLTLQIRAEQAAKADNARASFARLVADHVPAISPYNPQVYALNSEPGIQFTIHRTSEDLFRLSPHYDEEHGYGHGFGERPIAEAWEYAFWAYPIVCAHFNLRMAVLNDVGSTRHADVFHFLTADDPSLYPVLMLEFAKIRARQKRLYLTREASVLAGVVAGNSVPKNRSRHRNDAFIVALFDALWNLFSPVASHYADGERLVKETHRARTELMAVPERGWGDVPLVKSASALADAGEDRVRNRAISAFLDLTSVLSTPFQS